MPSINPRIEFVHLNAFSTTSTSFTPTDGQLGMFEWDSSKYSPTPIVKFGVIVSAIYGATPNGVATVTCRLYNKTDGAAISGTDITFTWSLVTQSPRTEVLSADIYANLPAGVKDVYLQIKINDSLNTAYLHSAFIDVIQSGILASTRAFIPVGYYNQLTGTTYTEVESKRYEIDPAHWNGTIVANWHTTHYVSAGFGGRVNLRDVTNAADIVNVSSSSTTPAIGKTTFTFPAATTEYTAQIRKDVSGTVYIRNAFIILDLSASPTRLELSQLILGFEKTTTAITFVDTGAATVWRESERAILLVDLYHEFCGKIGNSAGLIAVDCRDDGVVVDVLQRNDTAYYRFRGAVFPSPNDLSAMASFFKSSSTSYTATLSSTRLVSIIRILLQGDASLPYAFTAKVPSENTLPVEILGQLRVDGLLPYEILQLVANAEIAGASAVVVTLRPDSNGSIQQWTRQPPVAFAWQNVDETPPDEDTTRQYTGSGSVRTDAYNIGYDSVLDGKTITQVAVFFRGKKDVTGGTLRIAALVYIGSAFTGAGQFVTNAYANYSTVWSLNPATGLAWTPADIQTLQIGMQSLGASPSNLLSVTQVWTEVTYDAGSGPIGTSAVFPVQILTLPAADAVLPLQILQASPRVDLTAPFQILTKPTADVTAPFEILTKALSDLTFPLQIIQQVDVQVDIVLPVAFTKKLQADGVLAYEILTKVSSDVQAPLEILFKPVTDVTAPVEILPKVAGDVTVPVQILSSFISAASDVVLPVEILSKPASDGTFAVEILPKVPKDAILPYALLTKVTSNATTPYHIIQRLIADLGLPVEILTKALSSTTLPYSFMTHPPADATLPYSLRTKVAADANLPIMIGLDISVLTITFPRMRDGLLKTAGMTGTVLVTPTMKNPTLTTPEMINPKLT